MKHILTKILFFYSALIAIVVTLSSGTFVFFFLPVLTYFLFRITKLASGGIFEKLLIYWGFIVSAVLSVTGIITAKSPNEYIVTVVFSPMLFYFLVQIFPKRTKAAHLPVEAHIELQPAKSGKAEKLDPEIVKLKKQGVDVDRRMFLKAIASAGLSIFMFALFTKKAEAAFFGSVPGPGVVSLKDSQGNKIDPAEKQPTDGYKISEVDDGTPAYFGFLNKDGAWYIMRDDNGTYEYMRDSSGFSAAWADRANPLNSWGYYDSVF